MMTRLNGRDTRKSLKSSVMTTCHETYKIKLGFGTNPSTNNASVLLQNIRRQGPRSYFETGGEGGRGAE